MTNRNSSMISRRYYSLFQLTRQWLKERETFRCFGSSEEPDRFLALKERVTGTDTPSHVSTNAKLITSASSLSHVTPDGKINMVDVSQKQITRRTASASCTVVVTDDIMNTIRTHTGAKAYDILTVAKIAGIQSAKQTSSMIPLCHQIALNKVNVEITLDDEMPHIHIASHVVVTDKTGCEMEALVAASSTALTIYDMCKAMSKDMVITDLTLTSKTGGKSGTYTK
jgi:molybdenum cofactor biosynthesis protein MoaC